MATIMEALSTGKGIRPKSGQSLIPVEWLASKSDLQRDPSLIPSPANPIVSAPRPVPASGTGKGQKQGRDWDIVTPPGSPTHFKEFCDLALIGTTTDVHSLPLLPPATPALQIQPYRGLGEQACTARLQQFEEMEHQKLGLPLTNADFLTEVQDAHDWNVMERIVWDQKRWERDEYRAQRDNATGSAAEQAAAPAIVNQSELVMLELVEDFDMDVNSAGEVTSCELECHVTAETHLKDNRQISMWLEKLFLVEECKLHPRVDPQAFRTEQVIRFLPDTEHVIELCNFKVLRSVMASITPPLQISPHFMFEDGLCNFELKIAIAQGHAENVDITFPMPDSLVALPSFHTGGDVSSAVFGQTTKLLRWQIKRLERQAVLRGTVPLHPLAPLPTTGPLLKLKFEVVGLNVSGVTVAAVEAASEAQPRLLLRHLVRSVDSTVQSTIGRIRLEQFKEHNPVPQYPPAPQAQFINAGAKPSMYAL